MLSTLKEDKFGSQIFFSIEKKLKEYNKPTKSLSS